MPQPEAFQTLYDLYIEDKSHRIRQSTLDNTKCVFNTHILPYFKNKSINSIMPTDIRTWQNGQIDMEFTPHLIAERIGDTVEMVNKVYGHLYPNKHNEVANRLNQLIVPN